MASWQKFSSSGVTVTTKIPSSSDAATPAISRARRSAISHMSVLVRGPLQFPLGTMARPISSSKSHRKRRSRIPVFWATFSAVQPGMAWTMRSLLTARSGMKQPAPRIRVVIMGGLLVPHVLQWDDQEQSL